MSNLHLLAIEKAFSSSPSLPLPFWYYARPLVSWPYYISASSCTSLIAGVTFIDFTFPSAASSNGWSIESSNPLAQAFVVHVSGGNYALEGVLRGSQTAGSDSFAFIAPLIGTLVTSYGGAVSFQLMFHRFFFTQMPLTPRELRVTITSIFGGVAFTVFKPASVTLQAGTWYSFNISLFEEGWSINGTSGNSARNSFLQIISSVQS